MTSIIREHQQMWRYVHSFWHNRQTDGQTVLVKE